MEYHKFYLLFAILSVVECVTVNENNNKDAEGKPKNPIIDFFEAPLKAFRTKPGEAIAVFEPQILKAPFNSTGINWFNRPGNLGAAAASTLTDWIRRNSATQTTTSTTTTTPEPPIIIDFSQDTEPVQTKTERKKRKKKKIKKVPKKKKTSKRRINFDEDDDEPFAYDEYMRPLPPPVPKKRRRVPYYDDLGDDYYFEESPVFNPHRNYYFHDENDYYMDDFDPIPFRRPIYEGPLKRHTSTRNRNRRRRPNRPHHNIYDQEDPLLQNEEFVQPFSDLPEETRPVKHGQHNRRKPQRQPEHSDPQYSLVIPVQAAFVQSVSDQIQSQKPNRKPQRPTSSYQDSLGYQTAVAFVPIPVDQLGGMQGSSFNSPSSGQQFITLPGMQIIAHHSHTIQTQPSQGYVFKPPSDKNTEEIDHEHDEPALSVKPTKKSQKDQGYNDNSAPKQKPTKPPQRPTMPSEQPPKPMRNPYELSLNGNSHKDKFQVNKKKPSTANKNELETDPNRPDVVELQKEDDGEESGDEKNTYITVGEERHAALPKSVESKTQYYVEPEYIPYLGSDSLLTVSNNGRFLLKSMRRRRTMHTEEDNPESDDVEKNSEDEKVNEEGEEDGSEVKEETQENREMDMNSDDENNETSKDEVSTDDDEAPKAAADDDENEEPTEEAEEDNSKTEQDEEETDHDNKEETGDERSSNENDEVEEKVEEDTLQTKYTDETENNESIDENGMPYKNRANSVSAILGQVAKAEHPPKQTIRSEVIHERPNGHFIIKTDSTSGKSDLTIEGSLSHQSRISPKFGPLIQFE